jgi:hypothetical protein
MTGARKPCCILLAAAFVLAGCDVFDSRLYLGAAADLAMSSPPRDLAPLVDTGGMPALCDSRDRATTCPGGYLFCDGFESESGSTFSSWTATIIDNYDGMPANAGTALSIGGAPVCLGQHSMHAIAVGGQQQAFAFVALARRPNPLHARLFFYVAQSSQPFQLLGLHAPDGKYSTLNVDPSTATFSFANNFSTLSATFTSKAVPRDRWLCLELFMSFDAVSGEVRLSLDGEQLGDFAGVNTEASGSTQDTVNVGIVATDTADNGVNEVFVDEVAIADHAIGCS